MQRKNLSTHTTTQERDEPIQTALSGPPPRPASSAGVTSSRCTGNKQTALSTPMGLGDILVYAFCAFIVGVFIFNLVDTAQTAKRKIAAKKHD